jgi:hypothetical protein
MTQISKRLKGNRLLHQLAFLHRTPSLLHRMDPLTLSLLLIRARCVSTTDPPFGVAPLDVLLHSQVSSESRSCPPTTSPMRQLLYVLVVFVLRSSKVDHRFTHRPVERRHPRGSAPVAIDVDAETPIPVSLRAPCSGTW